jgi:excisionase family DNA binding protein
MSATVAIDLATIVDAIADAVAARLDQPHADTTSTPWLNVDQAAAYIGNAPTSRIYDLVQQGKITPHRDGRRLLFHVDDLDAYLRGTS